MWSIVRCPGCKKCRGIRAKAGKCSYCGFVGEDVEVVGKAVDSSQLQREVALANMPAELRDEMRKKMRPEMVVEEEADAGLFLAPLRLAADEEGVVSPEKLALELQRKGILISTEDLLEEAVHQGLLLRASQERYVLLD
jgi:hypothetical protein